MLVVLPMFSGNSPEKLFRDKSRSCNRSDSNRRGGICPLYVVVIRKNYRCYFVHLRPPMWELPSKIPAQIKIFQSFCDEIHSGIWPEIPQEVIEIDKRLHLASLSKSTLVVLFQINLLPFPPMSNSVRVLILNNEVGISPASMLSSSQRDSNLLKFCIDDGIGPVNWLLLRSRKVQVG
ncbi:hypothetical protein Tco_1235821 [Tanacetum coccineum]